MADDDLMTVEEVAVYLGVSVATVRRKCASGEFAAEKVGRQWVVERAKLPPPRRRPSSPRRMASIDLDTSVQHLRTRDLLPNEVWVPDILLHHDHLAAESELKGRAAERLQNLGPFDPPMEIPVPKTALFVRAAAYPSIFDRVAYHACVLALASAIERERLDCAFSARRASNGDKYLLENGRDAFLRWRKTCRAAIKDGYIWMVRTDIVSYFDNIQLRQLFVDIDALGPPSEVSQPLKRMLGEWSHGNNVGIPQGPDASRLLGNHYLQAVDDAMSRDSWRYYRYMDDIVILGKTKVDVVAGVKVLQSELKRRGLNLASKKTELLQGDDALDDLQESELDGAKYHFEARLPSARKVLKRIFRRSLKEEGNVGVRWARFSLFRLRALRDNSVLNLLFKRLDDLAPVASIVATYLLPWLERPSVEKRLSEFLHDSTRNTTPYLSTWLMAAMLDRESQLPKNWIDYARSIAQDRNESTYHRVVATNVMCRGLGAADIAWVEKELRTEFDPILLRGYLVALARSGRLSGGIANSAVKREPSLQVTVDFLQGRRHLPSLVYSGRTVAIP